MALLMLFEMKESKKRQNKWTDWRKTPSRGRKKVKREDAGRDNKHLKESN